MGWYGGDDWRWWHLSYGFEQNPQQKQTCDRDQYRPYQVGIICMNNVHVAYSVFICTMYIVLLKTLHCTCTKLMIIFKVEMINKMYNFCWLLKFWFPRFVDFPAASPIWVIAFLALGLPHHHHLHKQQIKVFEKEMTVFLKMRRESLTFVAKHHQHCHPTVWRRKLVSWCELCEG